MVLLPVADIYDRVNIVGEEESTFADILMKKGLAEIVRNVRLLHRFQFCGEYDFADWEGSLGLFRDRNALDLDADIGWQDWKATALERNSGNERRLC